MLSHSLKEMQEDGLVHKKVFPEVPLRVEYSLTELEHRMSPVINSMIEWG